jgi:putative ABC transport system permease protein
MARRIPLAWLQLSAQKLRLLAAVGGITFAVMLILMQVGFRDALLKSATLVHDRIEGEIVLVSPLYEYLLAASSFPDARLHQALGIDGVQSVAPVYYTLADWKDPETGLLMKVELVGIEVGARTLAIDGVNHALDTLSMPDILLADTSGRPQFNGPLMERFNQGGQVITEVNHRRVAVRGVFELGTGFGVNGRLVTSRANFLRLNPGRPANRIDVGVVKLKPGFDPEQVRARIAASLPPDVVVLTREQFSQNERDYWLQNSPIGFIFNLGTLMGLIVGAVVVYQILYSDVSDHLAEYATLKAVGFADRHLFAIVVKQALILTALGFVPGLALAQALYILTYHATSLPIAMTLPRVLMVLALTTAMCCGSAMLAIRKLRSADPAEIF